MTALGTGLAVLPMVLFGHIAGFELVHPAAVVILGGLVTSTLLSLFVVPFLYFRFGSGSAPEAAPEIGAMEPALAPAPFGPRVGVTSPQRDANAGAEQPAAATSTVRSEGAAK
jgi:hypothetical protein